MLVITRKLSEEIIISDDIRVQVVDIKSGRVRLGIDAPVWMSIVRGELVDKETDPSDDGSPRQENAA